MWNAGGTVPPANLAFPAASTTLAGTSPLVADAMTQEGPAGRVSFGGAGAGQFYAIPDHGNIVAADFTVRARFVPIGFTGTYSSLFDKDVAGTRELSLYINASNQLQFLAIGNVSQDNLLVGNLTLNVVHEVVITRIGTAIVAYVDAVDVIHPSNAFSTTAATGGFMQLSLDTQGNNSPDLNWLTFQIWNRGLSPSEVSQLFQDPYGFLISDEGEMPALFVVPAGMVVTSDDLVIFELINVS